MQRNFYGIPTVDDELTLVFCIAYRSAQCPKCNGSLIEHRLEKLVNSFVCWTPSCRRIISREEMNAIDAAEMRGDYD